MSAGGGPGGRGGSRRRKIPEAPVPLLIEALEKHVASVGATRAFDLGPYQHLARNQAVSGPGLAHNGKLLQSILGLGVAELGHSISKAVLQSLLVRYPQLNQTPWHAHLWGGFMSERLGTMLAHLRRIARDDTRWQQMSRKCSPQELLEVEELKKQLLAIDQQMEQEDNPESFQQEADHMEEQTPCKVKPGPSQAKQVKNKLQVKGHAEDKKGVHTLERKKKLTKEDWAAFVAAGDGLAHLEAIHSAERVFEQAGQRSARQHQQEAGMSVSGESPEPSIGTPAKAVAKKVAGKRPLGDQCGVSSQTKKPRESQTVEPDLALFPKIRQSGALGFLWLTFARGQSYIQVVDPTGSKKKVLLVACSVSQCQHHQLLIHELAEWIISKGAGPVTKQAVMAKRDAWLQRMA